MEAAELEALISVIIPVYNAIEYLDKCVRSVLNQSYTNIEIILINDGSTDGSMELCEAYALREKNVRLFSQQNTGAAGARNLGLSHSKGEYIVFVDSDDWIMPTYIEELYFSLIKYAADMVIIDYFVEEDTKLVYRKKQESANIYTSGETLDHLFDTDKYMGYIWNKIFQARIIKDNHLRFDTELKVWEDLLFCCKYIREIKRIVYIEKPLYVYKMRRNSLTKNTCFAVQKSLLNAADKVMRLAQDSSSEFFTQTGRVYANACIDRILMEFRKKEYDIPSILEKLESAKPYFGLLSAKNKLKFLCLRTIPRTVYLLESANAGI